MSEDDYQSNAFLSVKQLTQTANCPIYSHVTSRCSTKYSLLPSGGTLPFLCIGSLVARKQLMINGHGFMLFEHLLVTFHITCKKKTTLNNGWRVNITHIHKHAGLYLLAVAAR